jgi:predicted unusual protein kinase regulating ubiquinone biosynthesis (AarF/ABC1/UbiB family)
MERLHGVRLTDFLDGAVPEARDRIVTTLVDCFAEQILEHGVFHADPHPGNFLVVDGPTGPRLALLDFGCVTRLPDDVRRAYAGLVTAVFAGDAERAAALFAVLGFATRGGDPGALHELAALMLEALREGAELGAIDPAAQLERALALLTTNPLARVPQHFVLIGRVLASLGGLVVRYPPRGGLFAVLAPRLMRAAAA